jgi:hypothetical protein
LLTTYLFMLLIPTRGAAPSDLAPDTAEQVASAELRTARNAVFLELGGSALFLSINYDRMISEHFSLRAGIGGFSVEGDRVLLFPILFNLLLGPPNDKLEIGAGVSLFFPGGVAIPIALGYRYAPISTGVSLRVAVTPFVFLPTSGGGQSAILWPWAGLSVGAQF